MNCLKDEIKSLIIQKRSQKANQLLAMRKQHARKKKAQESKLNEMKAKIAGDMLKASHKGDMSLCNPKTNTEAITTGYCDKHFWDQIDKNMECKDSQQFCQICCEEEIGEYHADERK